MTKTVSSIANQERALALLGSGVGTDAVASALGVTPAAISQLLADEKFASQVSQLRYSSLQKHNLRDSEYDDIEDTLIASLKDKIPLMMRPEIILGAIKVINSAKRRGRSAPEQVAASTEIVTLAIPVTMVQKFTTNVLNQVVIVDGQNLNTIDANTLLKQTKSRQTADLLSSPENITHDKVATS